ncbi:MAG: 2-C-methyl-D-erythritol 4-phosphate cytidylyltransferase [Kiritimatiellae bacterium]|nr:2-C-methyl-D-erythritol 4-phosphate cytidylyltransferase [Kiritimatiellia bacterium]
MTVAVVIAGGVGSRMGACVPKQFVEVDGRPVLFWTLEAFQRHPMIDAIELVLIDGWRDVVEDFKNRLGISKLKWIVPGGASAQETIRNGVFALEGVCSPDDIVVVHDGIRPLVESAVLDSVIEVARKFGDGVTSMPYNEQIFVVDEKEPSTTTKYIPRETLRRVATPQAYRFDLIDAAYHEAFEKGIGVHGSAYANTMMVELGRRLHFAAGSDRNLKLTTKGDLAVFKALVETEGPGRNP